MALLNSLFAGVSGLRNHQSMMDVIGNNIAPFVQDCGPTVMDDGELW